MNGVEIIGSLLLADANLLEIIPAERIKAAKLPDGISPPVLLVRSVSRVERQTLRRGAFTRTSERVSVAVRAANYEQQALAMRLVREACAGRTGSIGGAAAVSVQTAGTGPDLIGPGDTFEQTQDFRVGYDA